PGAVSACRKCWYDSICVVSRYGTSRTTRRLAKLLRMRFFSVNEYWEAVAMNTPCLAQTIETQAPPGRGVAQIGNPKGEAVEREKGARRRGVSRNGFPDIGASENGVCRLGASRQTAFPANAFETHARPPGAARPRRRAASGRRERLSVN